MGEAQDLAAAPPAMILKRGGSADGVDGDRAQQRLQRAGAVRVEAAIGPAGQGGVEAVAAELRTDGGIVSLVSHVRPRLAAIESAFPVPMWASICSK